VAKKKAPPAPPIPTPERVAAALRVGDFLTAVRVARELHALTPTPDHLELRKKTLATAAAHFADRDKYTDFNRVMTEAASLTPDDPTWTAERAALLARGGMLGDALRLVENHSDPNARTKVLGAAADRAIRLRSNQSLTEDLHPGCDAILSAFRHHEAGDEAAARAALEPVGLRSPFLEWKVLLRGLFAHAAGDDARAAENFARLDPARLPAWLAAPLRVAIDPPYKAALPPATVNALLAQHQKLTTGPLVEGLRAVAREIGRDRPLAPAFRAAEVVLPHLRQAGPQFAPRLANCLYHAIVHQGHPDDLPRYRKLFGNPPDDPNFHKLQALVGEAIGDRAGAHAHWQKFEQWLAANPPGWPPGLLPRARAEVWARMGENAEKALDEPQHETVGMFTIIRRDRRPKPLNPPADACFRRAVELAPDWPNAVQLLFEALVAAKKPADAEAAGRAFLKRKPENIPALEALANLLQTQGRTAEAAELWLKALAVNPLDKPTRLRAALAVVGSARRKLIEGKAADAEAIFEKHRALLDEQTPSAAPALRSVVLQKLGRPDEAEQLRAKAIAAPGARLGAAYRVMVDSQLAKLKPADKRAADKAFADELAREPTPVEANQLIAVYDLYHVEGVTYRGQKTHEKKVLDQVERCLIADAPEIDFERLGELLVVRHEWKHAKKFVDACRRRFPKNPVFLVLAAQIAVGKGERLYAADRLLLEARRLAEAATEPRHRQLLDRIARIQKEIDTPFDVGDFFDDLD
jgi:tetratricopeptide (TPR) repeat protein